MHTTSTPHPHHTAPTRHPHGTHTAPTRHPHGTYTAPTRHPHGSIPRHIVPCTDQATTPPSSLSRLSALSVLAVIAAAHAQSSSAPRHRVESVPGMCRRRSPPRIPLMDVYQAARQLRLEVWCACMWLVGGVAAGLGGRGGRAVPLLVRVRPNACTDVLAPHPPRLHFLDARRTPLAARPSPPLP